MKKILTVILSITSCLTLMSAQEVIQDSVRTCVTINMEGGKIENRTGVNRVSSVDFLKYLPFTDDWKFAIRSYRYAPFSGTKSEEMHYISANRLRTSFNKSIGLEKSQFTYKAGYDYMFEIMNTGFGYKRYYAWIGFGVRF